VSYTNNPRAGETIANLCEVVNLGTRNPLSLALNSSIEDWSGDSVPIPILFCAYV